MFSFKFPSFTPLYPSRSYVDNIPMKACEPYSLHIANDHRETESGDYVDVGDDYAYTNTNAYDTVRQ